MHTVSVSQGGEWERVDPEGTDPYGHAAQWSAVWGQTDPAERWVFHTLAHKLNPGHAFKSGNKMHTSTHRHSLNFCFGPSCLLSSSPPLLLLFSSHPSASLTHSLSPPHLTGAEDTNSLLVLFVCVCVCVTEVMTRRVGDINAKRETLPVIQREVMQLKCVWGLCANTSYC